MDQAMTDEFVIVDKDNKPVRDELEVEGLLICPTVWDAIDCIIWLLDDSVENVYRGLRAEKYDPKVHAT